MSQADINTKAIGLYRHPNNLNAPSGALMAADECVISRENIIERRKGYSVCNTGLPAAVPQQMFVSGNRLYVHINNQLYCKDSSGCNYVIVQGLTPTFNSPRGIWFNSTDLYVADTLNHVIRKINFGTGVVTTFAGTVGASGFVNGIGSIARFNEPYQIWGNSTDLYVADRINSSIRKIVLSTANVTTFAGNGTSGSANGIGAAARFSFPQGIGGDGTNLYVADTMNYTVRQIVIATANTTTLAGTAGVFGSANGTGPAAEFKEVSGVYSDGTNLYVGDPLNSRLRKVVIATAVVTDFDNANSPQQIGSDGTNLYYMGSYNIVQENIGTVTGISYVGDAVPGISDGTGSNARFNVPAGIWADSSKIYVADTFNNTIRKVTIPGAVVTTYAGIPGISGGENGKILTSFQGPT